MADSGVIYASFLDATKDLPAEQFKTCWTALLEYMFTGEMTESDPAARMFLTMAKPIIDKNTKKREAGSRGGRSKRAGREVSGQEDADEESSAQKSEANPKHTEADREVCNNSASKTKQTVSKHEATAKQTEAGIKQTEANSKQTEATAKQTEATMPKSEADVDVDVDVDADVDADAEIDIQEKMRKREAGPGQAAEINRRGPFFGDPVLDKAIADFIDSRQKMRRTMTDIAIHRFLKRIEKLPGTNAEKAEMIYNSLERGWLTVYTDDFKAAYGKPKPGKNRFSNFEQRNDYDFDDLERRKRGLMKEPVP